MNWFIHQESLINYLFHYEFVLLLGVGEMITLDWGEHVCVVEMTFQYEWSSDEHGLLASLC